MVLIHQKRYNIKKYLISKKVLLKYLVFPCGLIRGALFSLGLNCNVTADVSAFPCCNFDIQFKTIIKK